jgi:hypothetical protein
LAEHYELGPHRSQGLVDVLDRILDKGLVIVGDVRIRLADVELLTIQVRLMVCSIDKAEQIGLDWWKTDPRLSTEARDLIAGGDLGEISRKLDEVSRRLQALEGTELEKG